VRVIFLQKIFSYQLPSVGRPGPSHLARRSRFGRNHSSAYNYNYHWNELPSAAFETIYGVRLRLFKLKFGLKFLVSALQAVGVFALLFAGRIMVLNGTTEIRIVVAFISGLDRILDPWRELIAFVRSTSAARSSST
jgi:ABC-type bacteriocin/lantibiotic exporter with double-glycine peptidase domain